MGGATKLLLLLAYPFPRPSAIRFARRPASHLAALSSSPSSLVARPSLLPSSGTRLRLGFSIVAAEQVHTQAVTAREAYTEAASSASASSAPASSSSSLAAAHPWPEWLRLVEHVVAGGYSDRRSPLVAFGHDDDDSFVAAEDLTEGFVRAAEACLLFARDRPDLIRLLPKKDIEIVVENGSPFLFKNGANSTRRLKLFLGGDETNVLGSEKVGTVDVMRFLLSNVCNFPAIHDEAKSGDRELIQASTRSLLAEIVNMCAADQSPRLINTTARQTMAGQGMSLKVPGQNIEMKRGDWICPKCSFMNFARNMRCLECNEARPKRILTGGEWECPKCDFFNYGRNMSCLRCDCRRPGGEDSASVAASGLGYNGSSILDQVVKGSNVDKSEIERKLATNDEKAERWFNKMSQMGDGADLSSAIDDEDFPEIMPMRKGVNRFVVSTRKTPLERRLAAQNNNNSSIKGADLGSGGPSESSISQSLDRILGRTSSSATNSQVSSGERNTEVGSKFNSSEYSQKIANQRTDSNYVPFVPLPPDMFRSQNTNNDQSQRTDDFSSRAGQASTVFDKRNVEPTDNLDSFDNAEKWHNSEGPEIVKDVANSKCDDDFPEIMPMRKGENRFVISKKKDRTLTSPQYKRRMAMGQANSSNFVPFVPFPPDYFAKKDKQTPEASANVESAPEGLSSNEKARSVPGNLEEVKTNCSNYESREGASRYPDNQPASQFSEISRMNDSIEFMNKRKVNSGYDGAPPPSVALPGHSQGNQNDTLNSSYSRKSTYSGVSSPNSQQSSAKSGEDWKPNFSGKSLEGSAVSEEPDPLDMSEEAKAARWFRRAAQIKDISELANIPDEDFPEIMPMRKGVNRFVVSKRKTPLERRLTSPQYRRNLPIISSEPEKDAN